MYIMCKVIKTKLGNVIQNNSLLIYLFQLPFGRRIEVYYKEESYLSYKKTIPTNTLNKLLVTLIDCTVHKC